MLQFSVFYYKLLESAVDFWKCCKLLESAVNYWKLIWFLLQMLKIVGFYRGVN